MAQALALGIKQGRAFAHRHALQADQADALGDAATSQLGLDDTAAWVATLARAAWAPDLLYGPGQARLDGGGAVVDVVAIQAQAGFEPQGVARAQPGGFDFGLRQQRARQRLGVLGGHRDLEAVLAGVAGAGDKAVRAGQ